MEVPLVDFRALSATAPSGESSAVIRERVIAARRIQNERFRKSGQRLTFFAASDFLLIHGKGAGKLQAITELIQKTRAVPPFKPMPVLINEDDHENFDQPANNLTSCRNTTCGPVGMPSGFRVFPGRMISRAAFLFSSHLNVLVVGVPGEDTLPVMRVTPKDKILGIQYHCATSVTSRCVMEGEITRGMSWCLARKLPRVMAKFMPVTLAAWVLAWQLVAAVPVSDAVIKDWENQYVRMEKQIAEGAKKLPAAVEMLDSNALIDKADRDPLDVVLRRARALLKHLKTVAAATDIDKWERELDRVGQRSMAGDTGTAERVGLYRDVRAIGREMAFSNPLLDFDDVLFAERKCVGEDNFSGGHMTTASFGHTQLYGSGLYIACRFKSGSPVIVDVLENSILGNGPWHGQKLAGGACISPELSFDGKTILFAYAKPVYAGLPRVWEYTEENSFHIFKVNVDGSNLLQLTTGNHNDFDPCWLPGGRIAFISTRTDSRGPGPIYSRCFPDRGPAQFFLHSMNADGSDIIPLSFHETDEWQPSVNNDGLLVYTRWDYVDRNSNAAQHLWTCYPDGRDPRSPHGNYVHPFSTMEGKDFGPGVFTTRPCAEWHIRAVPRSADYAGSSKYVATAGPHHGEPFGALVLIDIDVEDDGLSSQVKRITPNRYPESEVSAKASWDYATPWPLSADFYLANCQGALCLLDKFGNCDLICAGPNQKLRPTDPIPLRSRPVPTVIPTQTWQGERASPAAPKATVAVMNVYDGDLPWPAGAQFKELRIIQYFPKSTQPLFEPTIGYAEQSLARMVLGVVPIEADGSAYFEAPVGKAIGFQVLDEHGMAVQSMRSVTYVHPGEQMTCFGCHESKWKAAGVAVPLAVKRVPSCILPEVGGLEPLNFHRLVKPVVESKCAACHKEKGKGPDMSYKSLQPYAFYLVGGKPTSGRWLTIPRHGGSRSVPGKHGAYGAPLLKYLDKAHYEVALTPEEFRRVTLWLDCNSNELGAYQDEAAQRRGELVWPVFDVDPANILGVERRPNE